MELSLDNDIQQYAKFPYLYNERKNARPFPQFRQTLSFMDLPVEVRIMIYRLLLLSSTPFELCFRAFVVWVPALRVPNEGSAWSHFASFRPALGVLRLNKLINREAAEVFYGENEFRFSAFNSSIPAHAFMATIGTQNTRFLRKLTLFVPFLKRGCYQDPQGSSIFLLQALGMPLPRACVAAGDMFDIHLASFHGIVHTLHQLAAGPDGIALRELQLLIEVDSICGSPKDDIRAMCYALDALRNFVEDLRISLVFHHGDCLNSLPGNRHYGSPPDTVAYYLGRSHWLFAEMARAGWEWRHVHDWTDNEGGYDVIEDDDILEDLPLEWEKVPSKG
ncbi:hypothetical protein SLS55_002801 [Diplodia seriata]|uniref:F-box domain-containing protein n=1 Tax=Diplodia seriata TaxID=420778 RepID=A0ABR3CL68_9PEZI